MPMFRVKLRPGDWLVLAFAIILVVGLSLHLAQSGGEAQVRIDGAEESWIYPLDADVEIEVTGPLGITHVHIHDGAVYISESPCNQKICIAAGNISSPGNFIACLPNQVLVRIEGVKEEGLDGVAF